MKKLVVLSGAGMSAESGLKTFRDSNGLWEGYDVMEVASPQGWATNRDLVLDFYNQRRAQAYKALPNDGHNLIAKLENRFDVTVITQNVDSLHEKAGSSDVIHLHGELSKVRSTSHPNLTYDIGGDPIVSGDKCENGSQLRPHIVWFGEQVPLMEKASEISAQADLFLVIGTSLQVYPAAGLIDFVSPKTSKYLIDPNIPDSVSRSNVHCIEAKATEGMTHFLEIVSKEFD